MPGDVAKLTPYRDGKRRKMRMTKLTAVALTAQGANPHANVTFFKSKEKPGEQDLEKRYGDMYDLLTSSDENHQHGVRIDEDCGECVYVVMSYSKSDEDEYTHDHPVVMNADGSFTVGENNGHVHEVDQARLRELIFARMIKLAEDETSKFEIPEEGPLADLFKEMSGEQVGTKEIIMTDKTKKAGDPAEPTAEDQLKAIQTELEDAKFLASLSDAEKTYLNSLDAQLEDDDIQAFRKADAAGRKAIVEKVNKAKTDEDPVVYTSDEGEVFRKSDDARLVAMAKRSDADRRTAIKERNAREDEDLKKAAETDFEHLPGDVDVRIALLRAVNTISDADKREEVRKSLKAHAAKFAPALKTVGTTAAPANAHEQTTEKADADAQLTELAKKRAAEKGEDFYTAYDAVSRENPELTAKAVG